MRLIDADELKKAINDFYDNHFKGFVPNELITYAKAVDEEIDNAPTVKAYTDCYDRYVRKNDEPFC